MSAIAPDYAAREAVIYPVMSFRAIVAGWLVATAVAALLYVGGLALGFSAFNAWHPVSSLKGIGIGTAFWVILTWITALFTGGLFASWFNANDDQTLGSVHGVAVWGLSVSATALTVMLGMGGMMHHPGEAMDGHGLGDDASSTEWIAKDSGSLPMLEAEVSARTQGHNQRIIDAIVAALLAGKDELAARLLAADNGTSEAAAAQTVQALSADVNAAQVDLKASAQRAAHYTATAMWILLLSCILSLLAAALGGWMGAGHIQRVYHLRKFSTGAILP
jgi:hypothetical protein